MEPLHLFVDGSVNNKLKIGYGAYLAIPSNEVSLDALKSHVKLKRFTDTSSTILELQTLVWALTEVQNTPSKILVYTDSQNSLTLQKRRSRMEQNNYQTAKSKLLKNHKLYRQFFRISDQLDCELIKVTGHKPSSQKNDIDRLFVLVDRASRKALKNSKNIMSAK